MLYCILIKPLAGYIFDHLAQKTVVHVAVLKINTGNFLSGSPTVGIIAGMAFGEKCGKGIAVRNIIGTGSFAVTDRGGMRHDHFDGKRDVGMMGISKGKSNILGNISVRVDQSPFDELPNANGSG